ncbi:MAG: DUF4118 domain-containing protein [Solirubrobacterales bacterium]|nr:DUF4118 domain-containing protein [Solirubrobacterales bacterium]
MLRRWDSILLRGRRPSLIAGVGTMAVLLAACTALVYPLERVTSVTALGVVYLLGVVIIATFWGVWLGIAMAVLSGAAYNFFHLPPVGQFTIADSGNWVALVTFLAVAAVMSSISELARARAREAERRRAEADLTAEMAQLLLARMGMQETLGLIGQRLAQVFELQSATIVLREAAGDARRQAIALGVGTGRLGTLLVPAGLPTATEHRLRRGAVPALTAVLRAALERERLVAEAVQTEGLRRSEAVKTAVLRAVSHDLRSPLTAMIAAGAAVRGDGVTAEERDELGGLVEHEGTRLSRLIDDLLDLSRLEADAAAPRFAECSIEEVIDAALAVQPAGARFDLAVETDLPAVTADFVQLERALANLLENATRFSTPAPVVLRARAHGDRVSVRVADRGPGIAAADQERIFEPFYRAAGQPNDEHAGSGLGLAIARGFVETNGGRIWVESNPGQGSVFVIDLPAAQVRAPAAG